MDTKTPRYYLGLDEKPTPYFGEDGSDGHRIRMIGVKTKIDGMDKFILCDKYTSIDIEKHDKAVRQEFWDIVYKAMNMPSADYYRCFGINNVKHLFSLTPDRIIESYKKWESEEADARARADIKNEILINMDPKVFKQCIGSLEKLETMSMEDLTKTYRWWNDWKKAKKEEEQRKIRQDVMDEMIRISQPVKDMGWSVKVQFAKDDGSETERR